MTMVFPKLYCNVFVIIATFVGVGFSQTQEGDTCIENYTNTYGKCTPARSCQSAREDFQKNGVRPTFCSYNFDRALVCCRDGSNILQVARPRPEESPVWGSTSGGNTNNNNNNYLNREGSGQRVSLRRCQQYSRAVTQKVEFLPLLPSPETMSVSAAKCTYSGVELIVGGRNAELGEFPHMVAIGWTNFQSGYSFKCGGSLISPRFVLTAGHCARVPGAPDPEPRIVRLGDKNLRPDVEDGAHPVEVPIRRIITHPEYRPPLRYNDIALLELATDVDLDSNVRPACLWQGGPFTHDKAIATGWGVADVRNQITSDELQKVSLSLLENNYCDRLLFRNRNRNWMGFAETQICAGELSGGRDTCQGDSGAPLQLVSKENSCIYHVIGVTSFGHKCAESSKPAIYTRVSSYLDWIESVVWPGE